MFATFATSFVFYHSNVTALIACLSLRVSLPTWVNNALREQL